MLFDLYAIPKEVEYDYWVKKVYFVSSVLNMDYFKLWDLPEYEFSILEDLAKEEVETRKKRLEEAKKRRENGTT